MKAEFFLEQFEGHKAKGLKAYRDGDGHTARHHLLKAAEYLFKLAGESKGRLADERVENAQRLVQMAKQIDPEKGEIPGRKSKVASREAEGDGEKAFQAVERPRMTFDDIAGLEDVKETIRLKMIYPFIHLEQAERYGIGTGGGVLLYGPPGTGKTMMARAIAGEIEAAFFTVKPSEILSKWVGDSEKNIQALFDQARSHSVSIIFIDEIESLVPRRRDSRSNVMQRVVPQILAELEGFKTNANPLLFVGATNEPWSLDPAVLRPGRFDELIYVGLPDFAACRRILELNLEGRPLDEGVDLDDLAFRLEGYSGADIRNVCRRAAADKFLIAVETGDELPIFHEDLCRVIDATKPSVSKEDLVKFEEYRQVH